MLDESKFDVKFDFWAFRIFREICKFVIRILNGYGDVFVGDEVICFYNMRV